MTVDELSDYILVVYGGSHYVLMFDEEFRHIRMRYPKKHLKDHLKHKLKNQSQLTDELVSAVFARIVEKLMLRNSILNAIDTGDITLAKFKDVKKKELKKIGT